MNNYTIRKLLFLLMMLVCVQQTTHSFSFSPIKNLFSSDRLRVFTPYITAEHVVNATIFGAFFCCVAYMVYSKYSVSDEKPELPVVDEEVDEGHESDGGESGSFDSDGDMNGGEYPDAGNYNLHYNDDYDDIIFDVGYPRRSRPAIVLESIERFPARIEKIIEKVNERIMIPQEMIQCCNAINKVIECYCGRDETSGLRTLFFEAIANYNEAFIEAFNNKKNEETGLKLLDEASRKLIKRCNALMLLLVEIRNKLLSAMGCL